MKIYFSKNESCNNVIITDGKMAKIYNGAPDGKYEGINLYEANAAEKLRNYFNKTELNQYDDIWCENELDYDAIKDEIEDAEIVYHED